jgi:hypothetical protein
MQRTRFYNGLRDFSITLLLLLTAALTYGQTSIGIGQWRVHYPYSATHSLVEANNKIFTASKSLVYYYDKEDGSLNTLSKIDGLYGEDINKIGSYKSKVVLVGYADGNIDMLSSAGVERFNDIERSSILGSKTINHFLEDGTQMILSADFGISIINMVRREVLDSYINISTDGTSNPFYASVLSSDRDSIYVVTEKGVMAARYSSAVNLRDFTNWKKYGIADGLPNGQSKSIGRVGETMDCIILMALYGRQRQFRAQQALK